LLQPPKTKIINLLLDNIIFQWNYHRTIITEIWKMAVEKR